MADEAANVLNKWRDIGSGDEVERHETKLQDEDEDGVGCSMLHLVRYWCGLSFLGKTRLVYDAYDWMEQACAGGSEGCFGRSATNLVVLGL